VQGIGLRHRQACIPVLDAAGRQRQRQSRKRTDHGLVPRQLHGKLELARRAPRQVELHPVRGRADPRHQGDQALADRGNGGQFHAESLQPNGQDEGTLGPQDRLRKLVHLENAQNEWTRAHQNNITTYKRVKVS